MVVQQSQVCESFLQLLEAPRGSNGKFKFSAFYWEQRLTLAGQQAFIASLWGPPGCRTEGETGFKGAEPNFQLPITERG